MILNYFKWIFFVSAPVRRIYMPEVRGGIEPLDMNVATMFPDKSYIMVSSLLSVFSVNSTAEVVPGRYEISVLSFVGGLPSPNPPMPGTSNGVYTQASMAPSVSSRPENPVPL